MADVNRPIKLAMHTYTLHLSGLGESWGFEDNHAFEQTIDLFQLMDMAVEWQLDGLHVTNVDLVDLSPEHLAKVKQAAADHDLYLEYNVSFDAPCDPRVNSNVHDALVNGAAIGAELVKFSLDIDRPRPLTSSCMHPDVMAQLAERYHEFKENLPLMHELGLKISIENHCDMFADEVIWLVRQLNDPCVGACVDTMNSLDLFEGPRDCVLKMAPYSNCCHFCDVKLVVDPDGIHFIGAPIGYGDIDTRDMMRILREDSELDRINFEVEYEIGDDTLEVAREKELEGCKKSIAFLRDELGLGVRGR